MLTEEQKELLLCFAGCNMDLAKTGRKRFQNRMTVERRLEQIYKKTNLNPRCFFDLLVLLEVNQISKETPVCQK